MCAREEERHSPISRAHAAAVEKNNKADVHLLSELLRMRMAAGTLSLTKIYGFDSSVLSSVIVVLIPSEYTFCGMRSEVACSLRLHQTH
ncbi:hypothetical protein SUGI_1004880 [Cryptomeria japonica]|nr:hypothetical protein SUGI_1004880 [Cryptomeria japonica]